MGNIQIVPDWGQQSASSSNSSTMTDGPPVHPLPFTGQVPPATPIMPTPAPQSGAAVAQQAQPPAQKPEPRDSTFVMLTQIVLPVRIVLRFLRRRA